MRVFDGWTRLARMALLGLQVCMAASAQEQNKQQHLGANPQASQRGQTGAELGSGGMAAAKSGEADGAGNLQLGGSRRPLYRLHRSDVLTLSFELSPEFDEIVTVQPDGFVSMKDAGQVHALGLTVEEFRVAVQRAYTGYLHDPRVGVSLEEFERPYFVAGGEVGKPGKYELRTDTTLMEAVEIAGGFTHVAKHSQVLLFRHVDNDMVEAHVFNLKKMLKDKSLGELPQLRPGDLVFVPQIPFQR